MALRRGLRSDYPATIRVARSRRRRYRSPRAVNQGHPLAGALSHWALLLNNDMIVERGFVDTLNDAFERVPDLFCATAQILFPPGQRREETGKAVWRRDNDLDFPVRCDDPTPGEDLTWVLYGSGGCSLFDTAKLVAIGGVSELYDPAYVEDLDFGFRAWKPPKLAVGLLRRRAGGTSASQYHVALLFGAADRLLHRTKLSAVRCQRLVADPALFRTTSGYREYADFNYRRCGDVERLSMRCAPWSRQSGPAIPAGSETVGHLSEAEILALTNGDVAAFPGASQFCDRTRPFSSRARTFPSLFPTAARFASTT